MKKTKTQKLKKYFAIGSLSFCLLAVGGSIVLSQYEKPQIVNAVEYDDEGQKITLSVNELNNYVFSNFNTKIIELYNTENLEPTDYLTSVSYNDDLYEIDSATINNGYYKITYVYESVNIYFNKNNDNKFTFDYGDFAYDLVINTEGDYNEVKQVIQLDIEANQPSDDMPAVLSDFMSLLIGGITRLAEGLATGVATMAKALFLAVDGNGAVTGLSVFGGIVAIFAGLALAVGITTKVYTWITSLGN